MGVGAERRLAGVDSKPFVLQIGNKDADTDEDAVKETDAERLAPGHPVSQWLTQNQKLLLSSFPACCPLGPLCSDSAVV